MTEIPTPPPGPPWPAVAARRFAAALGRRGIGARAMGGVAVALAALAAVLFTIHHPGLAAILGLLALVASELSLLPPAPLSAALALPVDLLIGAGIVAGALTEEPPVPALGLLGLFVLLLLAWLPSLKAFAPGERLGAQAGIWRRPDRLAVLLLGALLGRLLPALLLVAVVGSLDAWLRLDRLDDEGSGGPSFLRPLLQPDGRLVPAVRWGMLAIALLVLLVLPRAEGWRF